MDNWCAGTWVALSDGDWLLRMFVGLLSLVSHQVQPLTLSFGSVVMEKATSLKTGHPRKDS